MIETERLLLIPCDLTHFEAFFQSEQQLAKILGVSLAKRWMQFPEAMIYGSKMLKSSLHNQDWGLHLFVHKKDKKLIGMGGYKGAADENGMVEIGYEISPDYQNQGLATEAARGMIERAFSQSDIKMIDAHTLAEENISCKILKKCGMQKIGEKDDSKNGKAWHWRIHRADYEGKNKGEN